MADDTSIRGTVDRSRINMSQPHEVRYWTTKFGVSEDQLKAAVAKVGTSARLSRKRLKRTRLRGSSQPPSRCLGSLQQLHAQFQLTPKPPMPPV